MANPRTLPNGAPNTGSGKFLFTYYALDGSGRTVTTYSATVPNGFTNVAPPPRGSDAPHPTSSVGSLVNPIQQRRVGNLVDSRGDRFAPNANKQSGIVGLIRYFFG